MTTLGVSIPAKINLHLQVLGRRADGFHELRSLFSSIDLYDDLIAEAASDGLLELEVAPVASVENDQRNLVLRAARALWETIGARPGAHLRLTKRIPIGAGLGGGSADAAAALVLLDRLWGLDLGVDRLRKVASDLGSDVPFFLHGGCAWVTGRGDGVQPLPDLPPYGVVVVAPGVEVATAEVYRRVPPRLTWHEPEATLESFVKRPCSGEPPWERCHNDLEPVVVAGWPPVVEALEAVRALPGGLRSAVTGSGGAVFVIVKEAAAATRAAADVRRQGWAVHAGRVLGRDAARPHVNEVRWEASG